jgi:hypothetical protein
MLKVELPRKVAENIGQFSGRVWLLPKLLEWWKRGDERLFLLTAGPGTGKSMLLAWLAGFGPEPPDPVAAEQLTRLRKVVKAAHFCQAASRNITPQAFAESIANQLTGSVTGFADALTETLKERVKITATQTVGPVATGGTVTGISIGRIDLGALGDELSFDRVFTEPLKKLYANGHGESMLLLVDALDETQTYTGIKIPDLLSRLSDLPGAVHILGTTRDEPRVLKLFEDVQTIDLVRDAAPSVNDVRVYVAERLAPSAFSDDKRRKFANRLAKQSHGIFLYAAMVIDQLLAAPRTALRDVETGRLPDGLTGLYREFLNRELGKDERQWFNLYEPLLGLIAVAQGEGLTAKQLTDIIGVDIRPALRPIKQYLAGELPEGPFLPFHKSFADFLLEDKDNIHYHVDPQEMHRRVAALYEKFHDDWSGCDPYGIVNVVYHLVGSNQLEQLAELMESVSFCKAVAMHLKESYRILLFLQEALSRIPEKIISGSRKLSNIVADGKRSNWQENNVASFSQCLAHIYIPGTHDNSGSKPHYDESTQCNDCGERQLVHECYWDEASAEEAYYHYTLCLSCFKSYFARNTTWGDTGPVWWNPELNAYVPRGDF